MFLGMWGASGRLSHRTPKTPWTTDARRRAGKKPVCMGATHTTTRGMAIEDHPHPPAPTSHQAARISVPDNPSWRTDPSSNLRRGLFEAAPAGQVHVSGYRQGAFIIVIPRPSMNPFRQRLIGEQLLADKSSKTTNHTRPSLNVDPCDPRLK